MKVDYLITNGEKKIFQIIIKNTGSRNTKQDKQYKNRYILKVNLFLSYKERTKQNIVILSKISPNNQIITTCRIELRVQEMTMNEKLTMIGLTIQF